MGQNAYLVSVGERANHSFVTDSCTKCHMSLTPPPDDISYNFGGTNHTFYASKSICADCHGQGFEAESIQQGVQDTLDILQEAVEDAIFALIDEQTGLGNIIDLDEEAQITDAGDIEEIIFGEYHGRQAITVFFEDDETQYGPYAVRDVLVLDANEQELGQLYDFAEPNLVKAGWNWNLINNDGSLGIHNPTWAYDVMVAGIEGLGNGAYQRIDWPKWYTEGVPLVGSGLDP